MVPDASKLEELCCRYFEERDDGAPLDDSWINSACDGDSQLARHLRESIEDALSGSALLGCLTNLDIATLHTTYPQFDKLKLLEPIGGGGFGYVYKACQIQLHRVVAVKFFPKSAIAQESFSREKEILKALGEAERIPDVHDAGEIPGYWYICMDFVPGPTLAQWRSCREQVSGRDCICILDGILDGLEQAHRKIKDHYRRGHEAGDDDPERTECKSRRQDLIHADLKPENLILQHGNPADIRILDFGVAQLFDAPSFGSTMAYASPEMVTPVADVSARRLTVRSDIFQIGVIGFEVITGGRYWELSTVEQRQQLANARCPGGLGHCLTKALQWNPEDRFQSVSEFRDCLKLPGHKRLVRDAARSGILHAFILSLLFILMIVLAHSATMAKQDVRDRDARIQQQDRRIDELKGSIRELEGRNTNAVPPTILTMREKYDHCRDLYVASLKSGAISREERTERLEKAQNYLRDYVEAFGAGALHGQECKRALAWFKRTSEGVHIKITPKSLYEWNRVWNRNPSLGFEILHNGDRIAYCEPTPVTGIVSIADAPTEFTWRPFDVLEVALLLDGGVVAKKMLRGKIGPGGWVGEVHVDADDDYKFVFEFDVKGTFPSPPRLPL